MRYLKLSLAVCLLVGVGCSRGPKAEQEQSAVAPVRIIFEVAGRRYEAVSFLRAGESWVTGEEMIARTDAENGGGLGQEESEFLWDHRSELPKELAPYFLVFTKWRDPVDPRYVRSFFWHSDQWYQRWDGLGSQWYGLNLVVRR